MTPHSHSRGPILTDPSASLLDFRALFAEHSGFVWRVLKRQGVPERELPDACQEVFLVVHRREAAFEGRSSVRTWLYGIALRVALAYRRKAHVRRERLDGSLPDGEGEAGQEGVVASKETLTWLARVLGELDEEKREAFVLYELEGMSLAELAHTVGVPEGTALYRLHQAREHVQRCSKRAQLSEASRQSAGSRP